MAPAFAKATEDKPAAFSALCRAHVLTYAPRAKVPAALAERTPRLREGMLFEHSLSLFFVTKDVKDQFHFEKLQFFQKSL